MDNYYYSSDGSSSFFNSEKPCDSIFGFDTASWSLDDISLPDETEWKTLFDVESGSVNDPLETWDASFQTTETRAGKSKLTLAQREKKRNCDARYRQNQKRKADEQAADIKHLKEENLRLSVENTILKQQIEFLLSKFKLLPSPSIEEAKHGNDSHETQVDRDKGSRPTNKGKAKDSVETQERGDRNPTMTTDKSTGKQGRGGSLSSDPPKKIERYDRRGRKKIVSATTEDGYAWKKCGEQMMHNSKHPRAYFRCSGWYDQGCVATKRVQRLEDDPQMFETLYAGTHTCIDSFRPPQMILPKSRGSQPQIPNLSAASPPVNKEGETIEASDCMDLDPMIWKEIMGGGRGDGGFEYSLEHGMGSDYGDCCQG